MSLPTTHRAFLLHNQGPNNTLTLTSNLPLPVPGPGEVLIKNTHAGINYIDNYFRSGLYPIPNLPTILGHEGEGYIAAIGPTGVHDFEDLSISELKIGDRVAYTGKQVYGEYAVAPAMTVFKLPSSIPPGYGAAALLQGQTALALIRESYPAQKGDWILVHAASGGVGIFLVQLLSKVVGAHVIATASTDAKLELARQNGAEYTINYLTTPDWVAAVKFISGVIENGGVNAVYDGVGKLTFDGDLEVLKRKGTLVTFGNASGAVEPLVVSRLTPKAIKLLRPILYAYIQSREEFNTYANELFKHIADETVKIYIHNVYPWEDLPVAHEDIKSRGTTGKLLLRFD